MSTATAPDIVVEDYQAQRRSLRIAVVTETYLPEVNGVARTLARLCEGLHRREHDLQLIRPRQADDGGGASGHFEQFLTQGLPIPRYPDLRVGMPAKRALVHLWSKRRPDIVHIATEGPLGWSALSAAMRLGLPVSSDFRTNFHAYTRHYGVGWLKRPLLAYLRKFHNRTGCTMVPTDGLRQELAALGFQRLQVVARGVDTELFQPERRSQSLRHAWGAAPGDVVVACVGRLASEKNLMLALEAYRQVRRDQPSARLLMVGDGPLRAALAQACPEAIFAGARFEEDLASHYASADLFLFPSLTDTFGNVVVEAMASGLSVVAYDYAAPGQLIRPGINGLTVRVGEQDDFIAATRRLASDPVRRQALGRQARVTALEQSWSPVIEQFEGILKSLVASAAI